MRIGFVEDGIGISIDGSDSAHDTVEETRVGDALGGWRKFAWSMKDFEPDGSKHTTVPVSMLGVMVSRSEAREGLERQAGYTEVADQYQAISRTVINFASQHGIPLNYNPATQNMVALVEYS